MACAGASASQRPLEPGTGELAHSRKRAREIEIGLQKRDLRSQHIGIRRHAGAESLGQHAARLGRGTNARSGRFD